MATSKTTPKVLKTKNWFKWEVEFNENATEAQKAKSLAAIKKYIAETDKAKTYGLDPDAKKLPLTFTHKPIPKKKHSILFNVNTGDGSITGLRPPPPPPGSQFSTGKFLFVKNIKRVRANAVKKPAV